MRTLSAASIAIVSLLGSSLAWAAPPIYNAAEQDERGSAPRDRLVFSALGPSAGHGAGSAGVTMLLYYPSLDLRYTHALSDRFAFEIGASTLGIVTLGRIAGRLRLFGNETFSMALRAGGSGLGSVLSESYAFAPTGGLITSFGSQRVQVTLSVDAGAGPGRFHTSSLTPVGEGSLGVELPVSSSLSLLIAGGCSLTFFERDTLVLPRVTFGVAL